MSDEWWFHEFIAIVATNCDVFIHTRPLDEFRYKIKHQQVVGFIDLMYTSNMSTIVNSLNFPETLWGFTETIISELLETMLEFQ